MHPAYTQHCQCEIHEYTCSFSGLFFLLCSCLVEYWIQGLTTVRWNLEFCMPEMVIFKSKKKKFEGDLKTILSLKTMSYWLSQVSVKYLAIKIYNLSWKHHDLSIKLKRTNRYMFYFSKQKNVLWSLIEISRSIYSTCYFCILLILQFSCLSSEFYHYSMDCEFPSQSLFKQWTALE